VEKSQWGVNVLFRSRSADNIFKKDNFGLPFATWGMFILSKLRQSKQSQIDLL